MTGGSGTKSAADSNLVKITGNRWMWGGKRPFVVESLGEGLYPALAVCYKTPVEPVLIQNKQF